MLIDKSDNVRVDVKSGHKYAVCSIKAGENVVKYGQPIGHATSDIAEGELVHSHNLATNLSGKLEYIYEPADMVKPREKSVRCFMGYKRADGQVGIRNDIWIINTVGCVNKTAQIIAQKTGAKYFSHPFGCSQLGGDQLITQKILRGLVKHPNCGGALVLGLGCENNNIDVFREFLGDYDKERVRFLNAQDSCNEIAEGVAIIEELKAVSAKDKREPIAVDRLKIGLKCGGSDAFSGITANPLVGRFCDKFTSLGGCCVLTEVPEMFGAEHLLMRRCADKNVFDKAVKLINDFKDYFTAHGQVIYENPSPGNKAGGITTLEEKSLGCIQKGGTSVIADVLDYGDVAEKAGLSLLNGPGNDMVAITNLAAAGVHLILFTTGRGTPLGGAVPTVKISTNSALAKAKENWIDFDAGQVLLGSDLDEELFSYVIDVACGRKTRNEENGYEEISIFKDGVTL
ncbi:MAG: altronate dehydratase [Clostridia bacterium]|nr:altronate dehydratase [Clostridia bacterium]